MVIDDRVAVDAGSLAFSCSDVQRQQVRDVVLTHTHLDHIAGLPIFIDDLFSTLDRPICVHATREMIDILEMHVFNWAVYPRFSELTNTKGKVLEYREFARGDTFEVGGLAFTSVPVNHEVSACGYLVSDGKVSIAITGDTGATDDFWKLCNERQDLGAVFVECAFPNEFADLAKVSCHLTPNDLKAELKKFTNASCPIYLINLKPVFRDRVIDEIHSLTLRNTEVLEIGRVYDF
jgi:cAMP phosphodiesterase